MKPITICTILIILAVTQICLVSADDGFDRTNPGQQNPPNLTSGVPQTDQKGTQNPDSNQQGQQAIGQNRGQISPTQTQTNPGTGAAQPGAVKQVPSQPATPAGTQQPQKITSPTPGQAVTHKEPVSPTINPTQQVQEPARSPASGGQYKDVRFPPSFPVIRQDSAAIQVTSNPTGAQVYLDGSYQGITPSSGYLELSDLSPGTYTVRLTSSGYTDYSTEITLSRNEAATISADLTATYVPSQYGALSVQSNPAGAGVYLDNEYKGITPLTLQGVAIGSHSIIIKDDGYSSYSGDVYITSDQASGLSVTLTATVTQAPTTVPMQPPAPEPTKSPISPWLPFFGLGLAGLGFNSSLKRN
ncbi:MAG: PEGA domain-containing protein [Methanospirillum sp.]|uniref:PEGA domain-containing protein n=1 Tax=Methanospirillum sp. TaxID=45200 RepID=UPI0023750675|nr:PEGA domain-containing protein [Methanospirillum sp.]MDD1727736.1 PEGA domain-containing protein [Methanospirillum sp.]